MPVLGLSWGTFGPFIGSRRHVAGRFGVSGDDDLKGAATVATLFHIDPHTILTSQARV